MCTQTLLACEQEPNDCLFFWLDDAWSLKGLLWAAVNSNFMDVVFFVYAIMFYCFSCLFYPNNIHQVLTETEYFNCIKSNDLHSIHYFHWTRQIVYYAARFITTKYKSSEYIKAPTLHAQLFFAKSLLNLRIISCI